MKRASACMVLLVLSLTFAARADIPQLLNYQGVLTDAGGTAVPDGKYSLTFRLYTVLSGGTHIWQETNSVGVTKGIFNVVLGTLTSLNIDFDETYYMGISVEGDPELSPRIMLTPAAYSFAARSIYGAGNVFPSQGNVGIGMTSPDYDLHVYRDWDSMTSLIIENPNTGASSAERLIFRDEGGNNAGIVVFDDGHATSPSCLHLLNNRTNGEIHFITGDQRRMRIFNNGDVGIGTTAAAEKLDVGGAIKIGTTSNTNAGTIRWTGTDFEGYDGTSWQSFTDTGGGSLPAGVSGQTLRHNGFNWSATSNLYNDGFSIGIGTTSPEDDVHLQRIGAPKMRVETVSSTGQAGLKLKATGGTYDQLTLTKYAPSTGGTTAGGDIILANLSEIAAGFDAGPMLINVMTSNPIHFATDDSERMRLDENGLLGINTTTPTANLHVGGSVKIGTDTYSGSLELFRSTSVDPILTLGSNSNGGALYMYDEASNISTGLVNDANGDGAGYFYVKRDPTNMAFRVDGNYMGSGSPLVSIFGGSASTSFDMGTTGNSSVMLPGSSIGASEIFDEPGAASSTYEGGLISLTGDIDILLSRSISVPANGYVLVIGTLQGWIDHSNGITSYAYFSASDHPALRPYNQMLTLRIDPAANSGIYIHPVTVHGLFSVGSGTHTFYLLGDEGTGDVRVAEMQLSLLYIPTAYGTVTPTVAAGQGMGRGDESSGSPMTAADVERQRVASIEANMARMERELAEIREQFEALNVSDREEE